MFSSVFKTIFRLTERLPPFKKAVADTCTFKKEKLYGFEFSVLVSCFVMFSCGVFNESRDFSSGFYCIWEMHHYDDVSVM